MKKFVSASDLADKLGISPGRVRQLVDAGVLPRAARNEYPLVEARRAYDAFKRTAGHGDESAYLKYLKLKNDLIELENHVRKGDKIHCDDFMSAAMSSLAPCRSRLLSIPSKATPLLVGSDDKTAKRLLNRFVNEALKELRMPDFHRIAKQRQKEKRKA